MKSYFSFIAYIIVNKIRIISSYQAEFSYPTFMTDSSTNIFIIYRSNVYIMAWKATNKTVFMKEFPDRQIELKNY